MPKRSKRQQTIEELEQVLVLRELMGSSSEGEDVDVDSSILWRDLKIFLNLGVSNLGGNLKIYIRRDWPTLFS